MVLITCYLIIASYGAWYLSTVPFLRKNGVEVRVFFSTFGIDAWFHLIRAFYVCFRLKRWPPTGVAMQAILLIGSVGMAVLSSSRYSNA
jgi:hypothetical protein